MDRFQNVLRRSNGDTWDATSNLIVEFEALDVPRRRHFGLELESRIHHDIVWGGVIQIDFRRVWEDASREQVDGGSIYAPDLHDVIIMSAVNIYRKPHVRLRNIAEIDELVRCGKDFDWDALVRKVQAYQCDSLVYSSLHATKAVLEWNLPECVLEALRPAAIRRVAIEFINRCVSPGTICQPRSAGGRPVGPRRRISDVARRFLALDSQQLMRLLWFRAILHKILGLIKW